MSKHTPGKWTISTTGLSVVVDGNRIVSCRYLRDARLVAAGPELLRVLELIEFEGNLHKRHLDIVRNAISRATGGDK